MKDFQEKIICLINKQKFQKLKQNIFLNKNQIRKLQSDYDEKFLNEKSDFDKLNEEIFTLQQKIYEKDSAIVNLRRESDKSNISDHNHIREVYISDPTKLNVELNNELNYSREIMAKVSKLLNIEKLKNDKIEKKFNLISAEFEEYKNIIKTNKNENINKPNVINNNTNLNSKSSFCNNLKSSQNRDVGGKQNNSAINIRRINLN